MQNLTAYYLAEFGDRGGRKRQVWLLVPAEKNIGDAVPCGPMSAPDRSGQKRPSLWTFDVDLSTWDGSEPAHLGAVKYSFLVAIEDIVSGLCTVSTPLGFFLLWALAETFISLGAGSSQDYGGIIGCKRLCRYPQEG